MDKIGYQIILCGFFLFSNFPVWGYAENREDLHYQEIMKLYDGFEQDSLEKYPFSENDLLFILGIATANMQIDSIDNQVLADELFSLVAQIMESRLEDGAMNKNEKTTKYMLAVLRGNSYHISIPVSDTEKVIHYTKEGKFSYIFKRFFDRGYHWYFLFSLLILVALIIFIRKKRQS